MLSVHANRVYPVDKLRHFHIYSPLKASTSGQFAEAHKPLLLETIRKNAGNEWICFLDTRNVVHFELNGKPVALKTEGDQEEAKEFTADQFIAREGTLRGTYQVGTKVLFVPKQDERLEQPWEETVSHFATVQQYLHDQDAKLTYKRIPLDEYAPPSDDQVEDYMGLLNAVHMTNSWVHINSVEGGRCAALLVIMKDILSTASDDSLETIVGRCQTGKDFLRTKKSEINPAPCAPTKEQEALEINPQPCAPTKAQEKIEAKKDARSQFLRQFYRFAKTREADQTWTEWKSAL